MTQLRFDNPYKQAALISDKKSLHNPLPLLSLELRRVEKLSMKAQWELLKLFDQSESVAQATIVSEYASQLVKKAKEDATQLRRDLNKKN